MYNGPVTGILMLNNFNFQRNFRDETDSMNIVDNLLIFTFSNDSFHRKFSTN